MGRMDCGGNRSIRVLDKPQRRRAREEHSLAGLIDLRFLIQNLNIAGEQTERRKGSAKQQRRIEGEEWLEEIEEMRYQDEDKGCKRLLFGLFVGCGS